MRTDQEMIRTLAELVSIESVAWRDVSEQAPFGAGVARALDYALGLCRQMGMHAENRDGKVAWAEAGQGPQLVAIVPHLDVVPAGSGWTVEPFACTEKDGKLYGRGTSDNKGPAVACIYALADVMEQMGQLPRKVRIIFGQCEESGPWKDMEYYRAHEQRPDAGFTPDAEFPALCGEKGQLWLELSVPVKASGLESLTAGTASNMVAAQCEASFRGADGGTVSWQCQGRAAHATVPHKGENAITAMMERLDSPLVRFYNQYIGRTYHGEGLNCAFEDEVSGCTTLCAGTARTENGRIYMTLDIRYPVSADGAFILAQVQVAAGSCGLDLRVMKDEKPMYRDPSHPVMVQLLEAYREVTGDGSAPIVIGGGTYARALDNIIGFGAAFPGHQHTEHQADEFVLKEDFLKMRQVYRAAIGRLLTMDLNK